MSTAASYAEGSSPLPDKRLHPMALGAIVKRRA